MRRFVLVGLLMLLVASVVGAFVNGFFAAADASRVAQETGYGLSGADVMNMQRDYDGGPNCNAGGAGTFLLVFIGGTYLLGRSHKKAGVKNCPFCAEAIQAEAIRCRFCQADLVSPPPLRAPPGISGASK